MRVEQVLHDHITGAEGKIAARTMRIDGHDPVFVLLGDYNPRSDWDSETLNAACKVDAVKLFWVMYGNLVPGTFDHLVSLYLDQKLFLGRIVNPEDRAAFERVKDFLNLC